MGVSWAVNSFYQSGKNAETRKKAASLIDRGSFDLIRPGSFQQAILDFSRSIRVGSEVVPELQAPRCVWKASGDATAHTASHASASGPEPARGASAAEPKSGPNKGKKPTAEPSQRVAPLRQCQHSGSGFGPAASSDSVNVGDMPGKRQRTTELHAGTNPISWCSVLPDMPNLQLPQYSSSPRIQDFHGAAPTQPSAFP